MQQQRQSDKTAGCEPCPAFRVEDASNACAIRFSIVPSHLAAQVTDGVWNAVVTTLGKGTLLIRRPKNLPANTCALLAYEIRYIAPLLPPVQKGLGGRQTVGRGKKRVGTCLCATSRDKMDNLI